MHIEASKKGTSGRKLAVKANYFALQPMTKFQVFHYHVDFKPAQENSAFKRKLLMQQSAKLGGFLYDRGSSIFTAHQLPSNRMEITTRDRDEQDILITITHVGLISSLEGRYVQILNIIVKSLNRALKLQLVGRDYYDPNAKVSISIAVKIKISFHSLTVTYYYASTD